MELDILSLWSKPELFLPFYFIRKTININYEAIKQFGTLIIATYTRIDLNNHSLTFWLVAGMQEKCARNGPRFL